MIDLVPLATAAVSGGGITLLGQWGAEWAKSRTSHVQHEKSLDAQLEEHRDNLTFDLLKAARDEMKSLREEAAQLRPLSSRVAHLEEALDHIDAMLHARNDIERAAAEKRAKAFLKRLRPGIGELRNAAQTTISAQNLANDVEGKS
jgi:hypothetical protein